MTTLYDYYQSQGQSLPSVSQRQGVASQAGIQNYTGTGDQNVQLLSYLQGGGALNNLPSMNASVLNQNSNIPLLPQTTPLQVAPSVSALNMPVTNAVNPNSPNAVSQTTNQLNQQEQYNSALQTRFAQLSNKLLGKGAEQQQLEQVAGISDQQKKINDLTTSLAQSKARFDQAAVDITGKPIGIERQTGKIAQIQRNEAISLSGQSAVIQALQGNLEAAKSDIDHAIKLEFDPIEQEINNTKDFINMNLQNMDRVERRQAKALDIQLDKQKTALQNAREDKKFNAQMALELVKQGAIDSTQFTSILSGETKFTDAIKNKNINAAALGTDPLSSLQMIIKTSGGKADDKLKATSAVISAAQNIADTNADGKFAGYGLFSTPTGRLLGPKGQRNITNIGLLRLNIENWATGATVSDDQRDTILNLVPKKNDSDAQIRNKLNSITNYMTNYASGSLAAQGINYKPQQVDLFTIKSNPLGLDIDLTTNSNPLGI